MRILNKVSAIVLSALVMTGTAATAATFEGSFWNTGTWANMDAAETWAMSNAATASFTSTHVDYPNGSGTSVSDGTFLSTYLGVDAGSLSGAGSTSLGGSIFRFTGWVDLNAGANTLAVGSDDGFKLYYYDGATKTVLSQYQGGRSFGTTSATLNSTGGPVKFELWYFENTGYTGVTFSANGALANPVDAPAVPLPAAGVLLLGGVGAFGVLRRQGRKAA